MIGLRWLADGQPGAFGRVMRHNWADGPIPEIDNFRMIPAGEAIRAPCPVTNHLNVIGYDRSGASGRGANASAHPWLAEWRLYRDDEGCRPDICK
jgi:hypothetical protein